MVLGYKTHANGKHKAWVRVTAKNVAHKGGHFDELRTKWFAADAKKDIAPWRAATERELRGLLDQARRAQALVVGTAAAGFEYDVNELYLPAVASMPTFKRGRIRDMQLWVEVFRDTPRGDIKPHEIAKQLHRWRTVGPKVVTQVVNGVAQRVELVVPLAAHTVNLRLRALRNFYTVLDGRFGKNPARDVAELPEAEARPRAIKGGYDTIHNIIDAMPNLGSPVKAGGTRSKDSVSKVRVRVLAFAGLEPTEMMLVPDRAWEEAVATKHLVMPGRKKGRGATSRILPLSDDAIDAIKDLLRLKATGPFNKRSVLRSYQLACIKAVGHTLRLKDLRHTYGTTVYRATGSLQVTQDLLGHSGPAMTKHYAQEAMLDVLTAAVRTSFPRAHP